MTEKEKAQRKEVLKELIRDIHMSSFCEEEGRCGALDECIDTGEYDCSCCNINRVVKAFNRGIEFQKQKSPWISVKDDLPCNHKELIVKDEKGRWETKKVLVRIQETDTSFKRPYFADCKMSKWNGEEYGFLWHLCSQGYITHWMPIPELPKE